MQNTFNQQFNYYILDAADDENSWNWNLSPKLLWKNHEKILNPKLSEDETDAMIDSIVHDLQLHSLNLGSINDDNNMRSVELDLDRIGEMNL